MDKLKYIKLENEDGSYSNLIPLAVDSDHVDVNGNTLTNELNYKANNSSINNLQNQINSLASGSPAGVYNTVSDLTTADPDHNKIYLVAVTGHWYYYDTEWKDGGVYQKGVDIDKVEGIENDLDSISDRHTSINHFFCTSYEDGYYWNIGGGKSVNADFIAINDYMPVLPSTEYYSSLWSKSTVNIIGNLSVITNYYNQNKEFISGEQTYNFTTPSNCYYIRISPMKNTYNNYDILINEGHTPSSYFESYYDPYRLVKKEATPEVNEDIERLEDKQDALSTYKVSKNICNITEYEDDHYWSAGTGNLSDNKDFIAVDDYFPVESSVHYCMSYWNLDTGALIGAMNCIVCYYTSEKVFISGEDVNNFTTPYNCAYIRISPHKLIYPSSNIMIEKGTSISSDFEPYYEPYAIVKREALPEDVLNKKINYITVDANGGGDFTKVQAALASITDATKLNEYVVYIKEGTYDLGSDFTQEQLAADSRYSGIMVPDYVYLKGQGDKNKIILSVHLDTKHQYISALNFGRTSGIENLTIIGEKTRYAIHDDFGIGANEPYYRTIKNCIIKGINNYYSVAYGSGTQPQAHWTFEETVFDGSQAGNNGANGIAFTVHNSLNSMDSRMLNFNNCRFLSNNSQGVLLLKSLNYRSSTGQEIANNYTYTTFNNCKFGTGAKGFRLMEENASAYGSGCKYYVTGANNVNDTYEIVTTDSQDYSSRVDLL